MADLTYKVAVDTAGAEKNLSALNKTIGGLKSALAGLAIGSFIVNTVRSAQAAKDLSEQTGLAVQSVLGLREAFRANASSAAEADTAILRLTKNISDARSGNDELAKSFEQIGVNVFDATQTIDEQIIKTVEGLGAIQNQADQTRLALELTGKSGAANYAGIAASIRGAISSQTEAAQATIAADEAAEKFEQAIANLQRELLIVLTPLSDFVKEINLSSEAIKNFVKTALAIGSVVLTFTALGKAISLLRGGFAAIVGGLKLIKEGLAGLQKPAQSLLTTFKILGHYVARLFGLKDVKNPKNTLIEGFAKSFGYLKDAIVEVLKQFPALAKGLASIGAVVTTVVAAFKPDAILSFFRSIAERLDILPDSVEKAADYIDEVNKKALERWQKEQEKEQQAIQLLNEKVKAIHSIGTAYEDANKEVLKGVDNEIKYAKMTERSAEVERAVDAVRANQADTVKKLREQLDKLPITEVERRKAIEETIAVVNRDTEATVSGLRKKIPLLQQEREIIEARNRAIDFGEQVRQDTQTLDDLKQEISMIGMTKDQRDKLKTAYENEKQLKERLAAIDAEAARAGKNVTDEQIADFERRRQAAIAFYAELGVLQEQRKAAETDYKTVVINALDDIAQKYSTVNMIQDGIRMTWSRLEDAIDNFVQTGKGSFKDLATSIIADLTAMIAKALVFNAIMSVLGNIPGIGPLLKSSGMLTPRANGGPVSRKTPYLVGERGPELFVPNNSGNIVPNNRLSNAQVAAPVTNNYITNNINALDSKSVAQVFAENRKALLGSVSMAQKELPYGMA